MENIIRFDKNNVVEYPTTFQEKDLLFKLSKSPHDARFVCDLSGVQECDIIHHCPLTLQEPSDEWVEEHHRLEVFYGDKQLWEQDLTIKYCEDLKMEYLETTLFGSRKCLIFADGIIKYPY
jgi:hypothetical protein